MCGIVGIYNFSNNKKINKSELKIFNNSLKHRGPDGENYFYSEDESLGFGHRLLKIMDISNDSIQPFRDLENNYILIYNGEIFNFKDIKNQLTLKNYTFRTNSDTEVFLNSYIEWGEKCFTMFNGMWAAAIWDKRNQKLILTRDRFGEKPLYYLFKNNTLYFASEIKAFQHLKKNIKPNFELNYLIEGNDVVNSENTFLKDVKNLKGGFNLIVQNKKMVIKRWWNTNDYILKYQNLSKDKNQFFLDIFTDACKIRNYSEASRICTVSGGLDSSTIFYRLNEFKKTKGIFLNFDNLNKSDIYYKNIIQKNKEIIDEKILINKIDTEDIENTIYASENTHGIHLGPYFLYKKIRDLGYKVSIDGHGCDELLGGYENYKKSTNFVPSSIINAYYKLKFNYLSSKNYILNLNEKIFRKNLVYKGPQNSMLNRLLFEDFHNRTLPILLQNFDRLSMANSVEARSPFMDWRLVCFCFSLSDDQKINKISKYILKQSMKKTLPSEILNRDKSGFIWYNEIFKQEKIKNFFIDLVSDKQFKEIFTQKKTNKIKDKLINSNFDNSFKYLVKDCLIYILYKKFKS